MKWKSRSSKQKHYIRKRSSTENCVTVFIMMELSSKMTKEQSWLLMTLWKEKISNQSQSIRYHNLSNQSKFQWHSSRNLKILSLIVTLIRWMDLNDIISWTNKESVEFSNCNIWKGIKMLYPTDLDLLIVSLRYLHKSWKISCLFN